MFVLNIQVQTLQLVLPWYRWDTSSQIPCTMKTCLLLSWDHTILNIFDRIKFQSTKGWSHWINIYPNSIWLESQGCTWVFFFFSKNSDIWLHHQSREIYWHLLLNASKKSSGFRFGGKSKYIWSFVICKYWLHST